MERDSKRPREEEPLEMGGTPIVANMRIGGFIFLREIGSGGMARVLLASDPSGRLVALKVLRPSRFKTGLARFWREFRALSRIQHPNVIRVEGWGHLFDHPYIAMEYVDGPDLHTLIRGFRNWPEEKRWRRVEEILVDLCRALAAVHRRGLVHRDLKPSNVLIASDGTAKLTDFGIVKDIDPTNDPNNSTTLVGTWAYASPEQITGGVVDARSDLYSLGVILFAMLTGRRPFVANDMAGYLALHRDRPAPAPRDIAPEVPEVLDEICRRLLEKAPKDRYKSAEEILYRLEKQVAENERVVDVGWDPPIVGRALEIEALTDAVQGLTAGRGGVVVLEGEDGSGRSRLLEEASDVARKLGIPQRLIGFGESMSVFQAVLPYARDLARELGDRAPAELKAALEAFTREDARGDTRYLLYDGMRDGLRIALESPVLLLIDDLHFARPREIDLLAHLLRILVARDELPLLMVITLRAKANAAADDLVTRASLGFEPREILVGSLSLHDIQSMVTEIVGESLGARLLAQRLHAETEGNAYFVTEFLRALIAKGVIDASQHPPALTLVPDEIATGHLEIPLGIRQMMNERLESINEGDRRVLEVLAVGVRDVDLDVVLDVLGDPEDEVLDRLERLLAAGVAREQRSGDTIRYSVSHRKLADLVYRDLTPERRAAVHRGIAEALELHYAQNHGALETVGEHYRLAGDAGRAFRYLVAAATRLAERSLVQEAWDLTEKAGAIEPAAMADLQAQEFRSYRRDNLLVRANVYYVRGAWADAEGTYRAVCELAEQDDDRRAASEARLRLATVLRRRGQFEASRGFAEQALEAARRLHYRQGVAEALHCMAALAWASGDLDECERMANEGLLVAQGTQLADRRAELLLALTAAQATKGHLAAATAGLTEAEGIFRELRQKRQRCLALANLAELLTWQGEPLQARQRAHIAVQLATEIEYKLGRTAAIRAQAVAAFDLGLLDEAWSGLGEALQLARQLGAAEEIIASLVPMVQLAMERGDTESAQEYGARGFEAAEARDPEKYLPLLKAFLARALLHDRPLDALAMIKEAEAAVPSLPVPRRTQVQLAVAWAWLDAGDRDRARSRARTVLQTAGSRGFRLRSLEARALLAIVGDAEDHQTHRSVVVELVRDFVSAMSPEMGRAFLTRPFLARLDVLESEVRG